MLHENTVVLKNKCSYRVFLLLSVLVLQISMEKNLRCKPRDRQHFQKEIPTQVFSSKIFKNTFFYITTKVADF